MAKLDTLLRVAELSVDAARQAGSLALTIARRVAEPLVDRRRSCGTQPGAAPPEAQPYPPEPPIESVARPEAKRPPPPPPVPPAPEPDEPEPEPAHVDREAVVVAEFADPGASDGVGAQIRIDEPWPGYDELRAKQVTAQLADASAEMLAVVRLYEGVNRNRKTVLDTIDKRLAATGD